MPNQTDPSRAAFEAYMERRYGPDWYGKVYGSKRDMQDCFAAAWTARSQMDEAEREYLEACYARDVKYRGEGDPSKSYGDYEEAVVDSFAKLRAQRTPVAVDHLQAARDALDKGRRLDAIAEHKATLEALGHLDAAIAARSETKP